MKTESMSGWIVRGLKSALGADAMRHEWRCRGVFQDASPQAPSDGFEPPYERQFELTFLSDQ